MKKIFINEAQAKFINESILEDGNFELPEHLVKDLHIGNTPLSSLGINPIMFQNLLNERYRNVNGNFSDNMDNIPILKVVNKLNKLISVCIEKENNIKPQLEQICYNTLVNAFNIPEDDVEFSLKIEELPDGQQFHTTPNTSEEFRYDNFEIAEGEEKEVNKRRIINMLIVGASDYVLKKIRKSFLDDIFELDEELPYLYSKILKLNDYLALKGKFNITDKNHMQGGMVKVVLGNDINKTKIIAQGMIFPFLLEEALKGIFELFAANGLPKDKSLAKTITNKADILVSDPWNMRLGPAIWNLYFNTVDIKYLPEAFTILVKGNTDEFISLFKEMIYKTIVGQKVVQNIIKQAEHNTKYSDFEKDIMTDKGKRTVLEHEQ